jgi:hypothetical protein
MNVASSVRSRIASINLDLYVLKGHGSSGALACSLKPRCESFDIANRGGNRQLRVFKEQRCDSGSHPPMHWLVSRSVYGAKEVQR